MLREHFLVFSTDLLNQKFTLDPHPFVIQYVFLMKFTKAFAILVMAQLMTGCGTLFTGTTQSVQVNSIPSGAKVEVNGSERGQTPLPVSLKKGSSGQMITLSKDGYEKKSFQPQTTFNPVSLLNLFGPIAWIIDASTGGMYKYDPTSYEIQLNKTGRQ